MMQMLYLVILVLTPYIAAQNDCNESYFAGLQHVNYGKKLNFKYYPWTAFEYLERKVKFLHIKNEDLRDICKDALPRGIDELALINTNLEYLEPGSLEDSAAQNVVIEGNNIKTIIRGVFGGTNITSLILNYNQIEQIEEYAFENMFLLEAVALDENKISVWDPTWFENARVLYDVSFTHNLLERLPEGATRNVRNRYKTFSSCILYGSINFDNNNITHINPYAFSNLDHFGSISLSNNQLQDLPEDVFKGFQYLFRLYMNTNNFSCFLNDTIESFKGVKRLYLAGNSLKQDCVETLESYFSDKTDLLFL